MTTAGFAVVIALLPACRRAVPPAERTARLLAAAEAQIASGQTNAVLVGLSEALRDTAYGPGRRAIFQRLLAARIAANLSAEAAADYRAAVAGQPEWALAGLDAAERALAGRRSPPDFAAWCEGLLADPLPPRARHRVWTTVLERHRQQGAVGPLASLFGSRIEALPPPLARQLVEESLTRMLRESQYDTMGAVLAAMPDRSERDPDLRAALAMYRVRLAAVRASPEEAVSSFAAELPAMRHRAPEAYSVVSSNLRRMAATNLIERLAMVAVSDAPPSQPVFRAAANELLSLALDAKRYAAVPPALVLLRRRGMAPGDLAWQFRNVLYPTMEYADAATRTNLLSFAEAFHAGAAADPAAQAEVGRLLLDGCFVAEDYDRALRLLEGGLALRYEEWRAMTLIKVRAHRAQARGEIREAIGLFREFMTKVAPDEQFTDPVSGARVSGRLVLGINAARIGGLWASLGDAAQSADAYREAKAHYGLALGQVAKGSLDERQVEAALKRLPAVADATAP